MAARSNKYTSLNLNGIFEKKLNTTNNQPATNSSSSNNSPLSKKAVLSNSRIHGHMLVLTRPKPKPNPIPIPESRDKGSSPSLSPPVSPADQPQQPDLDLISLRPQGRTGSGPAVNTSPLPSPSPSKFVPPHLRPGFAGREEKPGQEKGGPGGYKDIRGHRQVQVPGPGYNGSDLIEGRPKSGGGYGAVVNRPGSSGARPSSS